MTGALPVQPAMVMASPEELVVMAQPMTVQPEEVVVMAQPEELVVMAQPVLQMGMPVADAMDEMALQAEADRRAVEGRIRAAEQRAQQAEAAMRLQEAEMRARAAEETLAQQARMAALEKALRDAMPGWFGVWTDRSTATLLTAIAQAEAAAPPAGSSLLAALNDARAALRGQGEAKARKEAEERVKREAEERARREAEERARAERARQAAAQRNRLKLVLQDGRGIALEHRSVDATHGRHAHFMRMASAAEAIEVEFDRRGCVMVVAGHHVVRQHCLDNWHGAPDIGNRQHFSTWAQTHSTHPSQQWTFNSSDCTISPKNARHLCLGWQNHAQLVSRSDHAALKFKAPGAVIDNSNNTSHVPMAPMPMQMGRSAKLDFCEPLVHLDLAPVQITGDCCCPFPPPVFICCCSDLTQAYHGGQGVQVHPLVAPTSHTRFTTTIRARPQVQYVPATGELLRPEACNQRFHVEWGNYQPESKVLSFHCGVFDCPDNEQWQPYS